MRRISIDTRILDAVRKAFPPQVARRFTSHLKCAEQVEHEMPGEVGEHFRQHDEAVSDLETLDQIITACHREMSAEETLRLILDIGDALKSGGDLKRADDMYALVTSQAVELSFVEVQGEASLRRGEILARQGRWQEAMAEMRRSRQLFESTGNVDGVVRLDNILGTIAVEQGNIQRAQEYFQKALVAIRRTQHGQIMGMVLMNLGIVQNILGHYHDALDTYEQARTYLEKASDRQKLASLHHNIGMSLLCLGSHSAALRSFDRAATLASKANNAAVLGLASLGKATLYYHQHNLKLALRHANAALEQFIMVNDRLSVADTYKLKGMIHRDKTEYDLAESYFLTSLRMNLQLKNQLNAGETYFEMGVLEQTRGNFDEALAILESARACFVKVGARAETLKTVRLIDEVWDNRDTVEYDR